MVKLFAGIAVVVAVGGIVVYYRFGRRSRRQEWKRRDEIVDLASRDSFPASDPPSWSGSRV